MLFAALFTNVKIWKQPRYLSIGEKIKKNVVSLCVENEILFNLKKENPDS
jgi:hypothetical protein